MGDNARCDLRAINESKYEKERCVLNPPLFLNYVGAAWLAGWLWVVGDDM